MATGKNGEVVNFLLNGMHTNSGAQLAGGKVYTYDAGTSNIKTFYSDRAMTTPVSNPITLDAQGKIQVYGYGLSKFLVKDSDDVLINNGTYDNISLGVYDYPQFKVVDYDDINDAITSIGATECDLLLDSLTTLSANLTIPITMNLAATKPGLIIKASTYTISFDGNLTAGAYQIFSGFDAGDISFGAKVSEIFPDWWTENTLPATTEMYYAIQAALTAGDGREITFLPVQYKSSIAQLVMSAGTYKTNMPGSAMIIADVAGDFFLKMTNNENNDCEIRATVTGSGILCEQDGTGSSINNYFKGSLKGPVTITGTKPTVAAIGTKAGGEVVGIEFTGPALNYQNYENQVNDMTIDKFDCSIHIEAGANANRFYDTYGTNYWYGILLAASDCKIGGGFWESDGPDASNITDAVRMGDGVNACSANKIFVGTESGSNSRAFATESGSTFTKCIVDIINDSVDNNDVTAQFIKNNSYRNGEITQAKDVRAHSTFYCRSSFRLSNDAEGGICSMNLRSAHETHTLALNTSSNTTTLNIPTGAMLLGASFNVNTVVEDDDGDDSWTATYVTGSGTGLVAAIAGAPINTKANQLVVPEIATDVTEIQFSPNGTNFTAGVIEVVAYYIDLTSLGNTNEPEFVE